MIALPIAMYILVFKEIQVPVFALIIAFLVSWALGIYIFVNTFKKDGPYAGKIFTAIILCMVMVTAVYLKPIGRLFINENRHSIRALRDMRELDNLNFYYNEDEGLRTELVYEANRTIRPLEISNDSIMYSKLPFVFVSGTPVDSVFKGKNVIIEKIGTFDNNWRKTGNKSYNKMLVREVAIIKTK